MMTPELLAMIKDVKPASDEEIERWITQPWMRDHVPALIARIVADQKVVAHPYEDPIKAIEFALRTDEGVEFLRLWQHGQWKEIDQDWPEFGAALSTITTGLGRRCTHSTMSTAEPVSVTETMTIPKAAFDWLMGAGPDPAGFWFGDFTEDHHKGAYWWRSYFKAMIAPHTEAALSHVQAPAARLHCNYCYARFNTEWERIEKQHTPQIDEAMVERYRDKFKEIWPGSRPDKNTIVELLEAAIGELKP